MGSHVFDTGYITGPWVWGCTSPPEPEVAICDGLAYAEVDEIVAMARSAKKSFYGKYQWNALGGKGVHFGHGETPPPLTSKTRNNRTLTLSGTGRTVGWSGRCRRWDH